MNFEELKNEYYHLLPWDSLSPGRPGVPSSDIVLHLPVLEWLASHCYRCTEFGVRDGHSTVALLAGCPGVVDSYDTERTRVVDLLHGMDLPAGWRFIRADTGDPDLVIGDTDLLFFDTQHTYAHLRKELSLHGRKASRYLAFHDTFTCAQFDLSGPDPAAVGVLPAIEEFRRKYRGDYRVAYQTDANNGLLVLERL